MASQKELRGAITSFLNELLDEDVTQRDGFREHIDEIASSAFDAKSVESLGERLDVLYEQEKKHLELIKEYKEEIKFARTMQEDLRRERSQFFAQVLKDVSSTLSQAQVEEDVSSEWISELVHSYTASLDVSADLARTTSLERLGHLNKASKETTEPLESEVRANASPGTSESSANEADE